jgi:tRNA-dihydrouridine synthase 1
VKVPIFCKIRRVKSEEKTIELAQRIEKAGCSLLTVHGRVKEQNKEILTIPVVANGGIYLMQDVNRCLAETNVDGVMSAEALLENPALFSGQVHDLDRVAF